ncbi:MAG: TIGR03643 family protein [Bdellovibrionales bacterium]|nr:TIGR03643 family protein [Ramlibacter sp.]
MKNPAITLPTSAHPSDERAPLSPGCISRIVEMAWEDRTGFEAIEAQFGLNESAVIALMRKTMKPSSFRMWRKRVTGRRTKHAVLDSAIRTQWQ